MRYIRDYYGVPAKRGMRVIANGHRGVICGSLDHYLRIRPDGDQELTTWHPTWRVIYLPDTVAQLQPTVAGPQP
jgi:hypothetical protein